MDLWQILIVGELMKLDATNRGTTDLPESKKQQHVCH